MQCPNDNTTLQMTSREGIEIDYCPQCRGVWLDRGELDKLIERSMPAHNPAESQPPYERPMQQQPYERDEDEYKHRDQYGGGRHEQKGHHKKESFIGDLFDF